MDHELGLAIRRDREQRASGLDDVAWLDTSTLQARWNIVSDVLSPRVIPVSNSYSTTETAAAALAAAEESLGFPALTTETRTALLAFATSAIPASGVQTWERGSLRAQRQNALRHLIANSPDLQVS